MKGHAIIGFNHGVLGLAENPARGTGFWSQNTKGIAQGVLTEKARPEMHMIIQPFICSYCSRGFDTLRPSQNEIFADNSYTIQYLQ